MLSKKAGMENNSKKIPEPKYDRLPVTISVSYCFPIPKKNKNTDFISSHSIDISSNGIAIQIMDTDDDINKKLNTPNHKIITRIELPKTEEVIELRGAIKWVKTEKIRHKFELIAGIEFDEADYDKRLLLLNYALNVHRKQKIIRISTILLSVLLLFTAVLGFRTFVLKQVVEKKLAISEVSRNNLKNEIDALLVKKAEIEVKLEENIKKIEVQMSDLSKLSEDLDKTTKTLDISSELIANFEERFFEYVVVSENENIFVNMTSDLAAFSNDNYIMGNKALETKKYTEATAFFRQFIKEMPTVSLGYSGLARTLYRTGKESESREVFKKYQELVSKKSN